MYCLSSVLRAIDFVTCEAQLRSTLNLILLLQCLHQADGNPEKMGVPQIFGGRLTWILLRGAPTLAKFIGNTATFVMETQRVCDV